ncbi:hypothetical protein ACIQU6_40515 [Streptomyces sp. NPDC090442]|uniref:hypothetical protein n=1 Tax=Streptomyces sp. NPDC090442 TaxID=3365962 RepID=UPI0038257B07
MKISPRRMTLSVYRVSATGKRTPIRTVVVRADDPTQLVDDMPGRFPPCACPTCGPTGGKSATA